MGASPAGKDQHADIGPEHGIEVGLEAFLSYRVGEVADVFFRLPILPVLVYIGPVEASRVIFGIAEVIHFVTGFTQRCHHFGLVFVPPAGGDVDLCHELSVWFVQRYEESADYAARLLIVDGTDGQSTHAGIVQHFHGQIQTVTALAIRVIRVQTVTPVSVAPGHLFVLGDLVRARQATGIPCGEAYKARIGRFAENRYLCRTSEGDAGLCGPVSWYSRNLQASGGCFFIFTLIASVIGLRVE